MKDRNQVELNAYQNELAESERVSSLADVVDPAVYDLAADFDREIAWGEYDDDLASYFDAKVLARVARIFATKDLELAYSLCHGDLDEIRKGVKDYAQDLALKALAE